MEDLAKHYQRKRVLVAEFVALILLPVLVLGYFSLPEYGRYVVLAIGTLYILISMYINRFSVHKVGLGKEQIKPSLKATALITIAQLGLFMMAIYLFPDFFNTPVMGDRPFPVPWWGIVMGYVFLSVPIQEFVFRGYLIPRVELVTQRREVAIVMSALVFGLSHAIFRNSLFVVMIFMAGIFWGWLFVKYRSLWSIQVSHAILGTVFILVQMGYFNGFIFTVRQFIQAAPGLIQ